MYIKYVSYIVIIFCRLWATGVSAGNEEGGLEFNSLYSLFSVSIILTDSGLDHIEEVNLYI